MNDGFDPIAVKNYVETLVRLDEVERALLVLDNVPAYYRDNVPDCLRQLRAEILGASITAHAYLCSGLDAEVKPELALTALRGNVRGQVLEAEVKRYNANSQIPHIVDVGPGEYFVPLGLSQLGYNFTYRDIAVDQNTQSVAGPLIDKYRVPPKNDQPRIFVALEIIEHLPSPRDLAIEAMRHCGGLPERIHLSTPQYTYDVSAKEWRKNCGLPHLRAYTPREFVNEASKVFPDYAWNLYTGTILSLRGMRYDLFDDVLNLQQ